MSSSNQQVDIGCWVKVREEGMDDDEVFRMGAVTRPRENQLAPDNPMGKALFGARPGDEVTVDGPVGPIKFTVLEVGQDESQ